LARGLGRVINKMITYMMGLGDMELYLEKEYIMQRLGSFASSSLISQK